MHRTLEFQSKKNQKISKLKEQMDNKEVKDCTFKPKIEKKRKSVARNTAQFLKDQKKYEVKKSQTLA